MPINVPRYLHLDLSKHVRRNISRFRLRAHTLKVEAAAWLEDGSRVCDQCPGEDEHVQNEVHALLFCPDHRVCELREHLSFLFTPFFEDFSAAQPFLLQQVNNQLVRDFLSQQNTRRFFFLSLWIYLWLAETSQQPISQTTWLVPPIVTIFCKTSYAGSEYHSPHLLRKRSYFGTGTRGPSKLAKQPNNHKTVAHIINPGEITRFVHATDLA